MSRSPAAGRVAPDEGGRVETRAVGRARRGGRVRDREQVSIRASRYSTARRQCACTCASSRPPRAATGSACASPPAGSARPPAEYAIRAADDGELGVLVEERRGIVLELVEVARPHGEVREHPGRDAPERGLGVPGAGAVHRVRLERPVEADALRGGPGIRPVEAGPRRRRVEPDERIHLADLPVARERDGRARVEQAPEPPGAIPALLADVLHPGAGDEVGRAVPGLHRRGDAEVAEPIGGRRGAGTRRARSRGAGRGSRSPGPRPRSRRARAGCRRRPSRACGSGSRAGRARGSPRRARRRRSSGGRAAPAGSRSPRASAPCAARSRRRRRA